MRVPEERREVRHLIRSQLAWAGFGALGNGLWITPHVDREPEVTGWSETSHPPGCSFFRAELGSSDDPAKVVADAWDLGDAADRYREFIPRIGRLRPETPEAAFGAQTELVHTWRRFPFLDPDLPQEMLPARWPRTRAHDVFRSRRADWQGPAEEYFASLEHWSPRQEPSALLKGPSWPPPRWTPALDTCERCRRRRTGPIYSVLTSFLFANSSSPNLPSSRPIPEFFTPPKGRSGALLMVVLMPTMPTSSWSAT